MSAASEFDLRKRRASTAVMAAEQPTVALRNVGRVAPAPAAPRPRTRLRAFMVFLLLLLAGWAGTATWFALEGRAEVQRLVEQQAELRTTFETYRINTGRRLAGTGASQNLEQDGLLGRLADMISRQVQLENRQAALIALGERLSGMVTAAKPEGAAAQPDPARPDAARPDPGRADAAGPKPGGGVAAEPSRAPGQRSGLDLPGGPGPAGGPGQVAGGRANLPSAFARLSAREQFDTIDAAMGRLDSGQLRVLAAFDGGVRAGVTLVRNAIAEVGLKIEPAKAAAPVAPAAKPGEPRKSRPDPFDDGVARLEASFQDLGNWRAVADAVPFRTPLESPGGNLTSNFGTRKDPFTGAAKMHAGMDFRAVVGTPIRATGNGRVITADVTGGYGNLVEVDHGNGVVTRYAHLSSFQVSVGQAVTAGTIVGLSGSTGRSTGPHLHYETRISGGAVDPGTFIRVGMLIYEAPGSRAPVAADGDEAVHD